MTAKNVSPTVHPTPRQMEMTGQTVALQMPVLVLPPNPGSEHRSAAELAGRWIADEFLVNVPVCEHPGPAGAYRLAMWTGPTLPAPGCPPSGPADVPGPEGYVLSIGPGEALLAGHDRQGLLYAVATLVQVLGLRDGRLTAPVGWIRDWPHVPVRYVHVYLPGRDRIAFFKRYVRDVLLRHRFNGLIIEVGGGARLPRRPEIATHWQRTLRELAACGDVVWQTGESAPLGPNRRFQDTTHRGIGQGGMLHPDDLQEVVAAARACGQEVVPEIQSLSHVYHLACAHRDIAELPHALFPDAYCPSNERSYELLFDVMDDYIERIAPPAVHIGHDEWRAAALCPACRSQDAATLFARDVIRVYRRLRDRGVGVWMWGDHFVSGHNETGKSVGRIVWYDRPWTTGAWKAVAAACPELVLLNWSWGLRRQSGEPTDRFDRELAEKGFRFLYGNFHGHLFEDWPRRSRQPGVLGAEVSSWCGMEEFELGKMHVANALYSIEMLWTGQTPPPQEGFERVASVMPASARRLKGLHQPPIQLLAPAQRTLDLSSLVNAPLGGPPWDLSGLRQGPFRAGDLDVCLAAGAVVVRRAYQDDPSVPLAVEVPVNAHAATLVFWQTASGPGRSTIHAGDATFYPRDASELLGVYDVVFQDGLALPVDIRYEQNVGPWDRSLRGLYYHARCVVAGTLPDGSPLVVWGNEWRNPRPELRIESIRFRGAGADLGGPSDARPMLLGITAVEPARLRHYRRELVEYSPADQEPGAPRGPA